MTLWTSKEQNVIVPGFVVVDLDVIAVVVAVAVVVVVVVAAFLVDVAIVANIKPKYLKQSINTPLFQTYQ